MAEQDLIERAIVNFPRAVDFKEMKGLLKYISHRLPANIHYVTSTHTDLAPSAKADNGSFKIGGTIRQADDPISADSFETVSRDRDYRKVSGIRFSVIPGYEEAEYNPEVLKLWENTRSLVDIYFKCRRETK